MEQCAVVLILRDVFLENRYESDAIMNKIKI